MRTSSGEEIRAPAIVSAIGARETVNALLPADIQEQEWAREIAALKPSICHFSLFLGFEGDIAQHGATRSNHWFYESWDTNDGVWTGKATDPIRMMFVSFPSLKDPAHDPGPSDRHTGDLLVWADWPSVEEASRAASEKREHGWAVWKRDVETSLMEYFATKFPALAPLVVYRELSTPFATVSFTGHEKGSIYGVETTPRRMLSDALNARTPVPGLYLAGQDVLSPGIAGAFWGGLLGAAAVDPRLFKQFR